MPELEAVGACTASLPQCCPEQPASSTANKAERRAGRSCAARAGLVIQLSRTGIWQVKQVSSCIVQHIARCCEVRRLPGRCCGAQGARRGSPGAGAASLGPQGAGAAVAGTRHAVGAPADVLAATAVSVPESALAKMHALAQAMVQAPVRKQGAAAADTAAAQRPFSLGQLERRDGRGASHLLLGWSWGQEERLAKQSAASRHLEASMLTALIQQMHYASAGLVSCGSETGRVHCT